MFIKILIVSCFGFLACQGYASQDAETSGAFDNVIEMLKNLEEQLNAASQNAINTLNENFQDMSVTIATIRQISYLAYTWRSQYVNEIEKTKDEYFSRGVDISNCTDDRLDILYRLPGKIVANVSTCFDTKYEKYYEFIEKVTSEINATLYGMEGYWDEITECQNKSSQEQQTCISKITSEITKDAASKPIEIESLLKDATEYIASLRIDLFHCYDGEVFDYRDTVQEILTYVWHCAGEM